MNHHPVHSQIIDSLKKTPDYISGEEISHVLKISRAAVWKYVEDLRQLGYDIVAVPHLGYRLMSCPDKLFPQEIQYHLGTNLLGKKIVYHETIDSTMDAAFDLARGGAPEGTVVCAETQTQGRGRLGRLWVSPKGKGIYTSLILRPKISPLEVARLIFLSAVAVSWAIKTVTGLTSLIKWPNDLMVKNKKLAGILTELSTDIDQVKFVVIGIGVNVNTSVSSLPAHTTSLKQETKHEQPRVALFQEMLRELEKRYLGLIREGFDPLLKEWKQLSTTLNRRVRVVDSSGFVDGQAVDIDRDGGLLIRQDSGIVVKKLAGDVVEVR